MSFRALLSTALILFLKSCGAMSLLVAVAHGATNDFREDSRRHIFPGGIIDGGGQSYNVAAFGANGSDTADDTAAFTKATTACGRTTGEIVVPAGTFYVSGISVPTGCTLRGAGIRGTIIKATTDIAGGSNIISVGTASDYVTDAGVRDLTVDGSKASYASSVQIAGIRVAGSRITVADTYVHDVTGGCIGVGLGTGTMGNIIIRDNFCHNPASSSGGNNFWGGYFIVHGDRVTFANNVHTQDDSASAYGFDCEPNSGQSVHHLIVDGGFLQASLKVVGLSGATTDHVRVTGTTIVGTGQAGGGRAVTLDQVTDVVLQDLYAEGPTDTSTGNTVSVANANNVQIRGGTYMHRAGSSRSRLKLDTVTTMLVDGAYWDIPSGNAAVIEEITSVSNFVWQNSIVNGSGNGLYATKLAGSTPYLRLTQTAQTFAQLPTLVRAGTEILCSECLRTNPCVGGGSGSTTIARRVGSVWNCSVPGELSAVPSSQTVADDGAGTAAAFTITATRGALQVTCNDTNGCNATLTETGITTGDMLIVENLSTNTVNIPDSSGVSETSASPVALGQYDTWTGIYLSDRWVQIATSNN